MSYEKQTWECGDIITAEKLNHIENGLEAASSGGGAEPLIVQYGELIDGDQYLNKTTGEIFDAANAHRPIYFYSNTTSENGYQTDLTPFMTIYAYEDSGEWHGSVRFLDNDFILEPPYPLPVATSFEELRSVYPHVYRD